MKHEIYKDGDREFRVPADMPKDERPKAKDIDPDWSRECAVCGDSPVVPITGLCGPCTYGESETAEGNW